MKDGPVPVRTRFVRCVPGVAWLLAWLPAIASAHTSGAPGGSWLAGFIHPFTGMDHFLAMVAVGIWAAQIGGRAMWWLPVAFPMVMALGGILGASGFVMPFVEPVVAFSVLILGLLILVFARPPLELAVLGVGVLAIFHGYAHGIELPLSADPLAYGFGFVVATTVLHGIGLSIGQLEKIRFGELILRLLGASLSFAGLFLLATLF